MNPGLFIAATVALLVVGMFVLVAALCRLAHIAWRTHKPLWILVYLLIALGALVAVMEATQGRWHVSELLLLTAAALYLWGSRGTWREGAPGFMRRRKGGA